MGRGDSAKLRSPPSGSGGGRRRNFSQFELCLLVPLTVFALALGIFSIVYILQHSGTIKPAAIAAICFAALLLVAIVVMVVRRLRRPDWLRDLESGTQTQMMWQRRQLRWTRLSQLDTTGLHTVASETRPREASRLSFVAKVRLAVRKTISSSLFSRHSFETTNTSGYCHLEGGYDGRISAESAEEKTEEGLWMSVFELAGDQRLDQLRRDNLMRPSKESRRSRYEMSAMDEVSAMGETIHITVTKPEPAATPPRSRRGSLSRPRSSRGASPSVSQDQSGFEKGMTSKHRRIPVATSPPSSPDPQFGFRPLTRQARGLRRLPSPETERCQDLRAAFKKGLVGNVERY